MRLKGIDSIRFICAGVVLFGHYGSPPLLSDAYDYIFAYKVLHGIYNCLFNGPAAVVIFFIISGLVIHYPYVDGKEINLPEFYLKRYTRVILPMLVITLLAFFIGNISEPTGVFWSLYAELIYYTLYPLILTFKKYISLFKLIMIFYVIGLLLILFIPFKNTGSYVDLGNSLTWVIGLPCWLTGVLLAEQVRKQTKNVTLVRLMFQRSLSFGITILMMVAHFHLYLSNMLLLNLLLIPYDYWLRDEIDYYKVNTPNRYLEKAGKWSYSLYICHPLLLIFIIINNLIDSTNLWLYWTTVTSCAFIFSYVFYLLIEKPTHKLAQKINIG